MEQAWRRGLHRVSPTDRSPAGSRSPPHSPALNNYNNASDEELSAQQCVYSERERESERDTEREKEVSWRMQGSILQQERTQSSILTQHQGFGFELGFGVDPSLKQKGSSSYWVVYKLPQINATNYTTFPIQIRKIKVQICSNFWVTQ